MRSIEGGVGGGISNLRDDSYAAVGGTAEPELGHPRGESELICICSSKTCHSLRPAAAYSAPQYSNQQSRMGVALNGSHYWDPNLWTSITAWVTKLRNDFFFQPVVLMGQRASQGVAQIRRMEVFRSPWKWFHLTPGWNKCNLKRQAE